MDWLVICLIIAIIVLSIIGLIGSVLPALPGLPFNYLALLVCHFASIHEFSSVILILFGILTLVFLFADYYFPIFAAKKFGGSKYGIWGSIIGLIAGLFFPPFGVLLGPFVGAVAGELIGGKELRPAAKAGFGAFIGTFVGTMGKVVLGLTMTGFCIYGLVQYF